MWTTSTSQPFYSWLQSWDEALELRRRKTTVDCRNRSSRNIPESLTPWSRFVDNESRPRSLRWVGIFVDCITRLQTRTGIDYERRGIHGGWSFKWILKGESMVNKREFICNANEKLRQIEGEFKVKSKRINLYMYVKC